jgi:hypothetical protein
MRRKLLPALLVALVGTVVAQPSLTRSVHGVVSDQNGKALKSAAVQIENTRTLQIRSFRTGADGRYFFHELSTREAYEIKARWNVHWSSTSTLARFDGMQDAEVNLTIDTGS